MSKGKRVKKKQPFVDIYGVLLLVATLVMSIGYAEIVGTTMTVETRAEASSQEGVFITDIVTTENNVAVNNYLATTMDTSITLDSEADTKKFTVTIYNKTVKPQVFIGVMKSDKMDEFDGNYTNTNISYTLGSNIVPHETILPAKDWITFDVELGFNGEGTMPETLRSLLNFRFQEVPTIQISDISSIENVYPNYTPQEITFTVSNQRQDEKQGLITNGVPLTYTIAPNVPAPLTAKIYDKDGQEVALNKEITISSEAKEEHTYKLKVFWDNTNSVQGKEYNSASYAGQILSSSIKVTATPTDENEKYLGYERIENKVFEVKTAPMYFEVSTDKTTVEMNNTTNAEEIILTIKNNEGSQKVNKFETEYKLSIDNSKFTLLVDGSEIGEEIQTLGNTATISQEHDIQLVSKDGQELEAIVNCNLSIEAITPYAKTETIELTIKDTTGPTAPVIEGGSTGTYAISQTISVSEVSTDVGTGVNKYQYLLNSDGTKTAEATADVTTTEASQTFTQDAPGYYVYFRAVDKAGNVGEWSNAQQIYIDTAEPTVGLADGVNAEITIEEGTQNDVASYFKYDKNGNAGIKNVTYTVNGKTIANTSELTEGTHTITCTVTKDTNVSKTANITVVVESSGPVDAGAIAENLSKYQTVSVNYEDPAGDPTVGWQIFHSDGENIYLIADDYVHYTYVPTDIVDASLHPIDKYKSVSEYRIGFKINRDINVLYDSGWTNPLALKWLELMVNYSEQESIDEYAPISNTLALMKTESWDTLYRNPVYAEYSMGGPTIEMVWDAFEDYVNPNYQPNDDFRKWFAELNFNKCGYYNAKDVVESPLYNYIDIDYLESLPDFFTKTDRTKMMLPEDFSHFVDGEPVNQENLEYYWIAGAGPSDDDAGGASWWGRNLIMSFDKDYRNIFSGAYGNIIQFDYINGAIDPNVGGYIEGAVKSYFCTEYYTEDAYIPYDPDFERWCANYWWDVGNNLCFYYVNPGVRPVVCLKSDITLEKAEDGSYNLVAPPVQPVTAGAIAADLEKYQGVSVNYEDPAGDPTVGWQIFHSDGENIYLIADDYVHYTYVPEDIVDASWYPSGGYKALTDYSIGFAINNGLDEIKNPNWTNPLALKWLSLMIEGGAGIIDGTIENTASLMRTASWDIMYKNPLYAEYTMGGPSVEMVWDALRSYMVEDVGDLLYRSGCGYYIVNEIGSEEAPRVDLDDDRVVWLFKETDKSKFSVSGEKLGEWRRCRTNRTV